MSTLIDIIEEEVKRLEKLIIFYQKEISKFPKGYISKKKINDFIYCYRSYRDGNTVRTVYIGLESSEEVKKMTEKIKDRKKLDSLYRQAKENLNEAKRALRAKR